MAIPIIMSIAEVADRYTIAMLKREHSPDKTKQLQEQVDYSAAGLDFDDEELMTIVDQLYEVNKMLWDTEDGIRTGALDDADPAVIGRLAMQVRDLNTTRCDIKNVIIEHTQNGFKETKINYGKS